RPKQLVDDKGRIKIWADQNIRVALDPAEWVVPPCDLRRHGNISMHFPIRNEVRILLSENLGSPPDFLCLRMAARSKVREGEQRNLRDETEFTCKLSAQ